MKPKLRNATVFAAFLGLVCASEGLACVLDEIRPCSLSGCTRAQQECGYGGVWGDCYCLDPPPPLFSLDSSGLGARDFHVTESTSTPPIDLVTTPAFTLTATSSAVAQQTSIVGNIRPIMAYQDLRQTCLISFNVSAPGSQVSASFDMSQQSCGNPPFTVDTVSIEVWGVALIDGFTRTTQTVNLTYYRTIRAMTYNVHNFTWISGAGPAIASLIANSGARIVGLQEIQLNNLNWLRAQLGWQYYAFCPEDTGIISKFPMVTSQCVPNFPVRPGAQQSLVEMYIDVGGMTLRLLNSHFDLDYYWLGRQNTFLGDYVRPNTSNLVITGDFNATPNDVMPLFDPRFIDSWSAPNICYGFECPNTHGVDYVILDHLTPVESTKVQASPDPSDHVPVWTRIELR